MRETGRCAQLRGSSQRDVAYSGRPWRVRNRGFCRGPLARSLVGIYFFLRTGSGRPMGAWVRVGSQVASTDVNSLPCAARFGSSGVRLGRYHNNFGVASLAGLP